MKKNKGQRVFALEANRPYKNDSILELPPMGAISTLSQKHRLCAQSILFWHGQSQVIGYCYMLVPIMQREVALLTMN